MALGPDGPAPYGPPGPLLEVVQRYRERGLQTPFTDEVLVKAGVNDSVVRRVSQALRQLDFTDAAMNPTDVLQRYSVAPTDEAKALLEKAVRDAYEPVFRFVNPAEDPPDRIRDAFRSYEPRGQQDRMVTLFLGLCRYVGIVPEPEKGLRPTEVGRVRQRTTKPSPKAAAKAKPEEPSAVNWATSLNVATRQPDLPPAVDGLVRELAKIGPTWTRKRRNDFMRIWEMTVDFSFPVREETHDP